MASYSEKMAAAQAAVVATAAASEEVYTLCQDGRYLIYTEYSDNNFSSIDISKNINVDKTQVNLVGEENAQYIPFKIKRYWDGIDLMNMLIQIHYQNSKGNGDINTAVNVRFSDEYITFGWLVKSNVTAMSGDVTFEITAVGVNEKGDNYRWRTKPNGKIKVTEALTHDGMIEPSDDWYTSFEGMILGYVNQAKAAADEAKSYADQINVEDVKDAVIGELQGSINSTLANYYTKTEIDTALDGLEEAVEAIDGLDKLSMTYNGTTGVLQLFNDGVALGDSVTINSLKNLKVTYTVENGIGTLTFKDGSKTLQTVQIGSIDPSKEWTDAYTQTIEKKIAAAVKTLSDQVTEHVTNAELQFTNLGETIAAVGKTLADDYYDKTTTDTLLKSKASTAELTGLSNTVTDLQGAVSQNTTNISSANSKIASIEAQLSGGIDTNYNIYDIMLETNDQQENVLLLLEGKKGEEGSLTKEDAITTIVLPAGSGGGGGGGTSYIKIQYVTPSQVIATTQDDIIISYKLETLDIDGDTFTCDYTWTLDGDVIATGKVSDGVRSFDVTDFMTVGTKELVLTLTGSGMTRTKTWSVQQIEFKIESNFNDTYERTAGNTVAFNFTPYGGTLSKTIHFVLNGEELESMVTTANGVGLSYTLPARSHGSYLLETYMTATLNDEIIESNHIYRDIMWRDAASDIPLISCRTQSFTAKQYDTTVIEYTVIDPSTETPKVTLSVDDEVVSTLYLTQPTNNWLYKTATIGSHTLAITCGEVTKTIAVTIDKLDINITPVTGGLDFDFNPTGYSNSDEDRLWADGAVKMTVSDNFDWVNGGYQTDANGDQFFCVKAGTTATINYNLFGTDAKINGKEFKIIFKTTNIKKRDTSFLTCVNNSIGLDMKVEKANILYSDATLTSLYSEDDIIEFEFNVEKSTNAVPLLMSYEDGTPNMPALYTSLSSFKQPEAQPITIGSANCDVHIYRMKAYSTALTSEEIKNNFIADARNAEEMVARYSRNQIYNEDLSLVQTSGTGAPVIDGLMKAAPDLRYIFIEAPYFTNDKSNKIDGTIVTMKYPNGRPEDQWTCTGAQHSGQGTSSNAYGYSARNLDLIMDKDASLFTYTTLKDEDGNPITTKKITLAEHSVPTDYLNIKVNVASSENQNNAGMTYRFNEYQPFARAAKKATAYIDEAGNERYEVKDTMEFYNCVVFVKESNTDVSTHREFNDTNWHFYAIGNVGDSKKTDDTRVNDKDDAREFVVEIMDYDVDLASFPTGKPNNAICPESEWGPGNSAYDILYGAYKYDDKGKFKSFGNGSYEFRYESKQVKTEADREININLWRDLYKFIVTSSDADFYEHLKDYFVVDTALYYYLFTERYTMVDNRAKNSFWHYGKVYLTREDAEAIGNEIAKNYIIDDEAAAINDGYRWDLTFGYDFDTCLGIDNVGKLVFSYGKEDVDYKIDGDPTSDYVFRVADSVFFCRVRDLFPTELAAMYISREDKNAWSATSLINQWDEGQMLFPEELWRLDFQRKYYRTATGTSVDNSIAGAKDTSFLVEKMCGRKKYQRRMFERNQENYFATKYFGNSITTDSNMMYIRGNNPIGATITPNYTLRITPYSDMYVCVQYGSAGGSRRQMRAKAGQECVFENDAEIMDLVYIYAAGYIQAIDDLSRCYIGDNNFSKGVRLQKLVIGSAEKGYSNNFMTTLKVENNALLEYLDVRNVTGLNTALELSGCTALKELYAEGTNAVGVTFANGGLVEVAHLPAVQRLIVKNLHYLREFEIPTYENLISLQVENTPFLNTYAITNAAKKLQALRLTNLNWDSTYNISDTSILNRFLKMSGYNAQGNETDIAYLDGYFYTNSIRQHDLLKYSQTWKDLEVDYLESGFIRQFTVTFVNEDGTVLDVQSVDYAGSAVDPITRKENPIPVPTKESSVDKDFTFLAWNRGLNNIISDTTITATYSDAPRKYTIKYVDPYVNGGLPLQTTVAEYGEMVHFTADFEQPPYDGGSGTYGLFKGWDKSGFVDGDKTINAVYDMVTYFDGYFDGKELSSLRPVEIYMSMKAKDANNKPICETAFEIQDTLNFPIGNDFNYQDVAGNTIIASPMVFDGTSHLETDYRLFEEDKDFTLVLDYELDKENATGSTLMQCFDYVDTDGFRLWVNGTAPTFTWGTDHCSPNAGKRESLVIRHKAGSKEMTVYLSNTGQLEITTQTLTTTRGTNEARYLAKQPLVFGARRNSAGEYDMNIKGTIYWCKLWEVDLGNDACEQLVQWNHENLTMELADKKSYVRVLEDGSTTLAPMTFLSTNLMTLNTTYATSTSGTSWDKSIVNSLLNERLYNSLSPEWKVLIKPVQVKSLAGAQQSSTISTESRFFLPSIYELAGEEVENAYVNEVSQMGTANGRIPYILSPANRVKSKGGAALPETYWTRSPSLQNANCIYTIENGGTVNAWGYPYNEYGIPLMFTLSV